MGGVVSKNAGEIAAEHLKNGLIGFGKELKLKEFGKEFGKELSKATLYFSVAAVAVAALAATAYVVGPRQ